MRGRDCEGVGDTETIATLVEDVSWNKRTIDACLFNRDIQSYISKLILKYS